MALKGNNIDLQPIGRGMIQNKPIGDVCICQRPKGLVFCHSCGHLGFGRVKMVCALHPHVNYLFDLTQCPKNTCRSIFTIEEIPACS